MPRRKSKRQKSKRSAPSPTKTTPLDSDSSNTTSTHTTVTQTPSLTAAPPPSKSGYLFKWQDREIGWGGTKWDLRFVRLERGRLYYYKFHGDSAPRYMLTLRNIGVRDDGYKINKKHRGKEKSPSLQTSGAYFHVFSLYQRQQMNNSNAQNDKEESIVPLLRFSSVSLAEKSQWIDFISEACAYCDSDDFVKNSTDEDLRTPAVVSSFTGDGTLNVPVTNKGTLPAMIFASPISRMSSNPSNNKLSRSKSNTKLKTPTAVPKSHQKHFYPPSRPFHRVNSPSYLSDEAPLQNYRGLLNLGLIILVISNLRILLGTIKNYGFVLANGIVLPFTSIADDEGFGIMSIVEHPCSIGLILLNIFVIGAYFLEMSMARNFLSDSFGLALHYMNANLALLVPMKIVWCHIASPLVGCCLMMTSAITWMKLLSYVHANTDHRRFPERNSSDGLIQNTEADVLYPRNVTLGNIYYFWFAPTLTYQITFPRSPSISWLRVTTLIGRLVLTMSLLAFLLAQVISPTLDSLVADLAREGDAIYSPRILVDYLLKLSIASTYVWLLVFYGYFHLFFNLLAEVLRFGDRVFYRDWWNSSNVSSYWRLWNLPVHYWLVRHLYFPCMRKGISKDLSMILIFFFSAVMHEVVISVPFHMLRPYSFLGMMAQVPLVVITKYIDKKLPGSSIGNIIFWITFCIVGQPAAVITYTIDYWKMNQGGETQAMQCWSFLDMFSRDEL